MALRINVLAALLLIAPLARSAPPAQAQRSAPTAPATTQANAQQPNAQQATLAEQQAEAKVRAESEVSRMPVVKFDRIADVIHLRIEHDALAVETKMPAMDESIVVVPGLAGLSKARRTNSMHVPQPTPILINFENVRFDSPDAVTVQTTVSYVPGRLILARLEGMPDDEIRNVQLIQSDQYVQDTGGGIMLFVQITGVNALELKLAAQNFTDLRRRYPIECARYLDPIFRAIGQESVFARVDPKLAWQIFADAFHPAPDVADTTRALVAELGSENFKQREAASAALAKLGEPAAIVLMRSDRNGFNDEQIARINAFLAAFRPVPQEEAEKLRKDPNFLLDCLYSENPQIRQLALAELRKVTGRPIEFNLNANLEQRIANVANLRESLAPTTRAAAKS
jgi:hypothetical protein